MRLSSFYIMLGLIVLLVWDASLNDGQLVAWLSAHASDTLYDFGLAQ
jgi:hypothetical protein